MTTGIAIDITVLREAVREEYEEVAACPAKGFHFHVGRLLASRLGYPAGVVADLPDAAVENLAWVGNPFAGGRLGQGAVVLDLGSGAGFDAILAARQVGPAGRVIGVDMTPAMLDKARRNAAALGIENIEFREGFIESLPVDDACIDVVISNGVINLAPDKESVFAEAWRVLRPGGRMQFSDIVVTHEVPKSAREDISLWTG